MGASLRSWWQKIKQQRVAIGFVAIVLVVAITLIIVGYRFDWTGFNGNNKSGKTLWDWMQLLFIPVVLAVAGFWFNHREQKAAELRAENERKAAELRAEAEREIERQRAEAEREIAEDNQREAALQAYINEMSELLLHQNLCKSEPVSEIRKVARVRTLTVLPRLDSRRKRNVLQFLYEASLINKNKSIVDLQEVDLIDASMDHIDLHGAMLYKVNLSGARLWGANLSEADLSDASLGVNYKILSLDKDGEPDQVKTDRTYLVGANLSRAILRNTDLYGAYLNRANLSKAVLDGANLSNANLNEADLNEASLTGANLSNANLKGTKVSPEQLDKAKSLKGATMPDKSKHP